MRCPVMKIVNLWIEKKKPNQLVTGNIIRNKKEKNYFFNVEVESFVGNIFWKTKKKKKRKEKERMTIFLNRIKIEEGSESKRNSSKEQMPE